jgi:hypothetical protein
MHDCEHQQLQSQCGRWYDRLTGSGMRRSERDSVLRHTCIRILFLYTIDLICHVDRSSRSLYFWTLLINTFTLRCKGTVEKLMVAQQIKKFATCMDPEKSSPDSISYAIPSRFNQSYCPQTHFNIIVLLTFMSLKQPQDSRRQKGDMNQVPY